MDLSPKGKSGLWDAEVGGLSGQGTSTREQSPKGGTLHGSLHKSQKGGVCTGGLMKDTVRDKAGEGMLNWTMGTLKIGLFHSIL